MRMTTTHCIILDLVAHRPAHGGTLSSTLRSPPGVSTRHLYKTLVLAPRMDLFQAVFAPGMDLIWSQLGCDLGGVGRVH
eukprot:COSAG06_NODE_10638_length_1644_cov_1.295793_1_plen_78_part_10